MSVAQKKEKTKVPAKMSAMAANASVPLVKKVRAGHRVSGPLAKKVKMADALLEPGLNKLLEEVTRIVNV